MGALFTALLTNPAFWTTLIPLAGSALTAVAHLKGVTIPLISPILNAIGLTPATAAADPIQTAAEQLVQAEATNLGLTIPAATLKTLTDTIVSAVEAQFGGAPTPATPTVPVNPATPTVPSSHPLLSLLASFFAQFTGQPATSATVEDLVAANAPALQTIMTKYPAKNSLAA